MKTVNFMKEKNETKEKKEKLEFLLRMGYVDKIYITIMNLYENELSSATFHSEYLSCYLKNNCQGVFTPDDNDIVFYMPDDTEISLKMEGYRKGKSPIEVANIVKRNILKLINDERYIDFFKRKAFFDECLFKFSIS